MQSNTYAHMTLTAGVYHRTGGTSPWPASVTTDVLDPVVDHLHSIEYWTGSAWSALDASNAVVTLDERRDPCGQLTFTVPGTLPAAVSAKAETPLRVNAGYEAGEVHTIFYGGVTETETVTDPRSGGPTSRVTAATDERRWDHPFPLDQTLRNVPNGAGWDPDQVLTDLGVTRTLYRDWIVRGGVLDEPNAARRAAFDQLAISPGDNMAAYARLLASTFDCWLIGEYRGGRTSGVADDIPGDTVGFPAGGIVLNHRPVYYAPAAYDLEPLTLARTVRQDLDEWGNLLRYTVTWGKTSTDTNVYTATGFDPATQAIREVAVTEPITPPVLPSGSRGLPDDWPHALDLVERLAGRDWVATITARACYWLHLRHSIRVDSSHAGVLSAIQFRLADGTMTATIRPQ